MKTINAGLRTQLQQCVQNNGRIGHDCIIQESNRRAEGCCEQAGRRLREDELEASREHKGRM